MECRYQRYPVKQEVLTLPVGRGVFTKNNPSKYLLSYTNTYGISKLNA